MKFRENFIGFWFTDKESTNIPKVPPNAHMLTINQEKGNRRR